MTISATEAQQSPRTAKVLAAAEELVVKQGFKGVTMAAVAQRAHVGKGTPYLYWRAKEDLFLELIAVNLAELLQGLAVRVRVETGLARAEQLCPAVAEAWLEHPLVRAVQIADNDVLGALLDDPRAHAVATEHGAAAVLRRLLPVWRDHGTVRTDWSLEDQASAIELVLAGYFTIQTRGISPHSTSDRLSILRRSLAALLQADSPGGLSDHALANEIGDVLDQHARQLREATLQARAAAAP